MAEKEPKGKRKSLPEDAEAYIAMAREKASPSGKIMERVKAVNQQRIENMTTELEAANIENALKAVKGATQTQNQAVVAQIFKDKSADEIKEILEKMTPEMIQKLQMIQKATDPVLAAMQPQSQPAQAQTGNELLLQYLLKKADERPAQQGITMADVVAIVKLTQPPQAPPAPPPANPSNQLLDTVKVVAAINDLGSKANRELLDLKLKQIEDKQPQDPIEQIKYAKEVVSTLGLGNSTSEIDLKLEAMRENRDLDMKRLDWEQKKYEMENEADQSKWDKIIELFQGPVGDVVKNIGSAGADRVRGGRGNIRAPKTAQTQCPNCKEVIFVDAEAETAICGKCGVALQKQGGAGSEPPAAAAAAPIITAPPAPPPAPAAAAVAPTVSASDGEGSEDGEDDGHNEDSEQIEQQ